VHNVGEQYLKGTYGTTPGAREGNAKTRFVEAYTKRFSDKPPKPYIDNCYDAIAVLALAIHHAKSSEPKAIRDALIPVKTKTLSRPESSMPSLPPDRCHFLVLVHIQRQHAAHQPTTDETRDSAEQVQTSEDAPGGHGVLSAMRAALWRDKTSIMS